MRKLFSFMITSVDGYHEGAGGAFDWPNLDDQFMRFALDQMNDIDLLLFGRLTYDSMAEYWPSADARRDQPEIAAGMNALPKVVFSSTLTEATWNNTTLVADDPAKTIAELKAQPGKDIALFGSPAFTASLLEQGLVDEVRVMVMPLLWAGGTTLFTGLSGRVDLQLEQATTFSSGSVLLRYRPAAA